VKQAPTHLEPSELLAVLRVAKQRCTRDWAMLLVGYLHGCRATELGKLTLGDVNLRENTIHIARLKGSLQSTQPIFAHKGQPLLNEVKALRQWLRERPDDGSDFLFLSQKGGRLSRSQIFRVFQACGDAAGLPDAKRHPHILKHSRGSHLVGAMDIALVRQALGHKSISSTMIYAHTNDDDAAREARRVTMSIFA
jgi:type 1 fimbriae regulatory protein FimB